MRQLYHQRLWAAIGLAGCTALMAACLMPSPPQADVPGYDKLVHLVAYLCLGAWFGVVFPQRYGRIFCGLLALGVGIECVQGLTDFRSFEVADMVADAVGIVAGLALARLGVMRWLNFVDAYVHTTRNGTGRTG